MPEPSADFSFDLYPGLDADLEAAFERNVALGSAEPGEVATSGLAAAVQNAIQPSTPEASLSPNVLSWARAELDNKFDDGALGAWNRLSTQLKLPVASSVDEMIESQPSFSDTLDRLYDAKQRLLSSGEVTPEGLSIGETMRLTLIPWKAFKDEIERLPDWVKEIRAVQGKTTQDDYFNDNILTAIQGQTPMYRDPDDPSSRLSVQEYLDKRIAKDGNWGVILTQTSDQAGVESHKFTNADGSEVRQSPDQMTESGQGHLVIGGQNVDALGIIEWLAMTMQHDPTTLSASTDLSWLLANRFDVGGGPRVPAGYFDGGQVVSLLRWAGNQGGHFRVRLAVI